MKKTRSGTILTGGLDINDSIGEEAKWNLHKYLQAVLNISCKQNTIKQQLYGPLLPISHSIQDERARKWKKKAIELAKRIKKER